MALRAGVEYIFRPTNISQHMVYIAFHYHAALLVSCHPLAVDEALLTETDATMPIKIVLALYLQASHTTILILLLNIRCKIQEIDDIELMLIATGIIVLDIHHFATHTIKFCASLAEPRTFLDFFT